MNMDTLNVRIDVSTSKGRKLAHELYGRKEVEIENPMPKEKTYTLEEVYEKGLDKMSMHYGVDMRKLKSDL
ncbi:hypothetical protein MASR2M117_12300 [Paludibacter sp.]